MTYTRTYVTLPVSAAAWNEIAVKLRAADYDHAFEEDGLIDMHGIALVVETPSVPTPPAIDNAQDAPTTREET